MKRPVLWILLLVSTLLLASCGAREALIDASAAAMNLTTEDLGRPAAMQERPREEILLLVQQPPEETRLARDANMRTFTFSETEVVAVVLVTTSSAEARATLRDARSNFESGLRDALGQGATIAVEELTVPQLGDETFFARVQIPGKGPGYILGFRKSNVAGLIIAHGPAGTLDEDWLRGLGQKMFQRLPAPTT